MESGQMKEIIGYVFGEAAKSNVEKRKVGCVITDSQGRVVGKGYNTDKLHAEVNACRYLESILTANQLLTERPFTVYVSHEPCPDCASKLLERLGPDTKIEVVKEFMKFDGDKIRYDLVPPSAIKAMAQVLTFGARKYKPNNWKNCDDCSRYCAALYRHLEAWRAGEELDPETGLPHLAQAMTNIAFMLELGYNPTEWSE